MAVSKSLALNAMFPAFFALFAAALSTILPLLILLLSEVYFLSWSWLCHILSIVTCYFWLLTRDWRQQQNAIDLGWTRWFSRHGVISRVRQFVKQHFQAKSAKSRQICKFIHSPLVRGWQLALFAKTFSVDQGQFPLTDVGLQAKRRFGFGAKK